MHRYPVELRIVKVNLLLWFSLSHIHTTAKTTENEQPESILGYGAPKWGQAGQTAPKIEAMIGAAPRLDGTGEPSGSMQPTHFHASPGAPRAHEGTLQNERGGLSPEGR